MGPLELQIKRLIACAISVTLIKEAKGEEKVRKLNGYN